MENMNSTNLKNVADQILPFIIKSIISIGIAIVLLGITLVLYNHIKQKSGNAKSIFKVIGVGISITISGLLVNNIYHFKFETSSYNHSVPIVYIILLLLMFCLYRKIIK